ncbi:MAG TPA: putative selenate reductase subunit YgfK, partial [Ignavibacteria bacterium]|nr:putative selenate reductase subunit YgfK [Ignavibacteria bacterium]
LNKMLDSSFEIEKKKNQLDKIYPRINDVEIPSQISNNVTLSTMHGCPPDEIEKIAQHLIEDWKFHTAVKLNPTILGKEKLREILNEKLNYNIVVPDEAFEHDLKFEDAVKLIERLTQKANENNVEFGLKMTNTLESLNSTDFLPTKENMVYMSGRALHPITVNAAALLQNQFNGELDISFSGGADAFNFADLVACNLTPVTVCSDLLKPGGYSRLPQYLENLLQIMDESNCNSIEDYITKKGDSNNVKDASLNNLNKYAGETIKTPRYKKSVLKNQTIKTKRELTPLDCIHSPCIEACAIDQAVPQYLYHASNGDFVKSYRSIINENPLPNMTGMVCDHLCQTKCTRMNIDDSLLIREIKRFVSAKESDLFYRKSNQIRNKKVAVIGAGPSGLSAAYFLALEGIDVDVYESRSFGGGMASATIPKFRIDEDALNKDIENIKSLGVNIHYNTRIDQTKFDEINNNSDYVYLAIGAQKGKPLRIEGEDNEKVIDQITFLEKVKNNQNISIGKTVAVIGGGNSAMDAARTAKRLVSQINGEVTVIYRRTKNEMPADKEEIKELLEEGIILLELTAPVNIDKSETGLNLNCIKMRLGEPDDSGRRRPVEIPNSNFSLEFDTIITAIGQDIVLDFLPEQKLSVDSDGCLEGYENIYAGGDAVRGADSLINAIADGKNFADKILSQLNISESQNINDSAKIELKKYQQKLAKRIYSDGLKTMPLEKRDSFETVIPLLDDEAVIKEASRCLFCDEICNICVSVCPNLANYYYEIDPFSVNYPLIEISNGEYKVVGHQTFSVEQKYQILNLYDFCNECGNCDTFCPTAGAPYKVKPRFCISEVSFQNEDNVYMKNDNKLFYKNNGNLSTLLIKDDKIIFTSNYYEAIFDDQFHPIEITKKYNHDKDLDTKKIAEMYYYQTALGDFV